MSGKGSIQKKTQTDAGGQAVTVSPLCFKMPRRKAKMERERGKSKSKEGVLGDKRIERIREAVITSNLRGHFVIRIRETLAEAFWPSPEHRVGGEKEKGAGKGKKRNSHLDLGRAQARSENRLAVILKTCRGQKGVTICPGKRPDCGRRRGSS